MKARRGIIALVVLTVLVLVVMPAVAGTDREKYEEEFERTEKLSQDGKVFLSNLSGDITIATWDRPEVKIYATKSSHATSVEKAKENAAHVTIEVKRRDGQLEIRTKYPERRIKKGLNVSIEYTLTIPKRAHVTINNVSGSIEAEDLGALAKLDTVSGNVKVDGASKGGVFSAVSGNVDLRDVNGDVNARTVSGIVTLGDVSGTVDAETVSGKIKMTNLSRAKSVDINVHSGSITFEGALNPDGRYSFGTHSGNVTLILPNDAAFDFNFRSFSGNLTTDFKVLSEFTGKLKQPRRDVYGEVNGGGADVTVETFSGNAVLEKAD